MRAPSTCVRKSQRQADKRLIRVMLLCEPGALHHWGFDIWQGVTEGNIGTDLASRTVIRDFCSGYCICCCFLFINCYDTLHKCIPISAMLLPSLFIDMYSVLSVIPNVHDI